MSDAANDLFDAPAPSKPSGRRRRVLVVDDSQMMRTAVSRIIERLGHEVTEAANGNEALGIVERRGADLVFLDLEMPVKDGITALRELRGLVRMRETPVILLTVVDDADVVKEAAQYGVKDYLRKPAHPRRIEEKVRKYLR